MSSRNADRLAMPHEPPHGLPITTRWRLPAGMAVDLIAYAATGRIAWMWMARHWHGSDVVVTLELAPEQWPPMSWKGYVSAEDVARLRPMFGGRTAEARVCPASEDLDSLMRRPWVALVIVVGPTVSLFRPAEAEC